MIKLKQIVKRLGLAKNSVCQPILGIAFFTIFFRIYFKPYIVYKLVKIKSFFLFLKAQRSLIFNQTLLSRNIIELPLFA